MKRKFGFIILITGLLIIIFSLTSEQYFGQSNIDTTHQFPKELSTRSGRIYTLYYPNLAFVYFTEYAKEVGLILFILGGMVNYQFSKRKKV